MLTILPTALLHGPGLHVLLSAKSVLLERVARIWRLISLSLAIPLRRAAKLHVVHCRGERGEISGRIVAAVDCLRYEWRSDGSAIWQKGTIVVGHGGAWWIGRSR